MKKEYYTIKEVAQQTGLGIQSIRKRIKGMNTTHSLLHLNNGEYQIHQLLLPYFTRKKISQVFAYTLDFDHGYNDKDINIVMNYILSILSEYQIKIEYVIENKKKDETPHVHAIIEGITKTNFIKVIHKGKINKSYHIAPLYDKKGWLGYMKKDNKEIITITNKK